MNIVNAHLALNQHISRTKPIQTGADYVLVSPRCTGWTIGKNYDPKNVERHLVLNATESDKTIMERIDIISRMKR